MAIGDDAIAAGMDVVQGSALANTIDTEITKTRDYIAQRTSTVTPVAKGGTGATNVEGARANLGVPATGEVTLRSGTNVVTLYWNGSRLNANIDGIEVGTLGYYSDIGTVIGAALGGYIHTSGGTIAGSLYLPNSSPADSGYTVAYINGDGRVSRGASSERYKKYISEIDPASLGDLWPDLVRYQMRGGDGEWKYGYIAEQLDESDDLRPFVVYNTEGQPDSIDFIALLMAQNAQLHQQLSALETRLTTLEARE